MGFVTNSILISTFSDNFSFVSKSSIFLWRNWVLLVMLLVMKFRFVAKGMTSSTFSDETVSSQKNRSFRDEAEDVTKSADKNTISDETHFVTESYK